MNEISKIASRENENLKYARRVRDGREDGKIFLEGLRLVGEAARSATVVECVFLSSEVQGEPEISDLVERLKPQKVFQTSQQHLQSLADTNNAQGIIAIGQRPESGSSAIHVPNAEAAFTVVFVDRVNKPTHLGGVVGTSVAAGVAGVILYEGWAGAV
jgi:tRNA G18 (ribose-2'-O)-methylase SpoU